jgi:hypothetical protein
MIKRLLFIAVCIDSGADEGIYIQFEKPVYTNYIEIGFDDPGEAARNAMWGKVIAYINGKLSDDRGDAYYYALQADHWARTGNVRIPDSSPVPSARRSPFLYGKHADDGTGKFRALQKR